MKNKKEKVIKVKINSSKERIFILYKEGLDAETIEKTTEIILRNKENKVWILSKDVVDSIIVFKDKTGVFKKII